MDTNGSPAVAADAGTITRKQAGIWIPILFAIISVAAVYALYAIDDVKNRDTILYAKFLANLKDRWIAICYLIKPTSNLFTRPMKIHKDMLSYFYISSSLNKLHFKEQSIFQSTIILSIKFNDSLMQI